MGAATRRRLSILPRLPCVVPGEKGPMPTSAYAPSLRVGTPRAGRRGVFLPGDNTWGAGASSAAWLPSDCQFNVWLVRSLKFSEESNVHGKTGIHTCVHIFASSVITPMAFAAADSPKNYYI